MGVDAAVDWSDRAGVVEGLIRRRYLRQLLGVVPGTRIGRVRWPRPIFVRPWPWHYWWQAHLLDCLVDAQRRAPNPARDRDRGAGPHRAAAQLRVVDQRLLRRHRLVRTRRAAGRAAGPPIR